MLFDSVCIITTLYLFIQFNSQFNDGGFGDIGIQAQYVSIGGNVIIELARKALAPGLQTGSEATADDRYRDFKLAQDDVKLGFTPDDDDPNSSSIQVFHACCR